ncbi:cell wall hydrolase [Anaerobacillus sp. MEB173]|uniref:cell wall hydrolase n=1 Tax=Anaerobacillus sp. MEB173 TaxID=3383345 RepID=UPI003F9317D1
MSKTCQFIKFPLICLMLVVPLFVLAEQHPAEAFTDQVIQQGATGDDVVELQARLQYIGFYNGTINGVFGWQTYWAVRNYQHEFGLEVDGLVGPKMKDMLMRSTKYDKEFVHKALNEGRKFTHYGGVPNHIQKGEKGSKDRAKGQGGVRSPQKGQQGGQTPQTGQTPPQQGQAPQQGQTPPQQGQAPQGGGQTPQQGQAPQGGQADQAPPQQDQPPQGGQTPAGETPPQEETPAPAPEQAEPQDNEANIQKAINVPQGFSENDIQIMANAVYGEARGEPYIGQVAVAAVILNRVNSPTFPNTVHGVIFEPRAFTAVADGQIWLTPNDTARRAVLDAINGQDPTGHALYYFNPDTATSGWIWTRPQIKKIGKHIFCK